MLSVHRGRLCAAAFAVVLLPSNAALAQQPLALAEPDSFPAPIFRQVMAEPAVALEPPPQSTVTGQSSVLPGRLRRQIVEYRTHEAPGTVIIDTPNTYLYYVLGNGRAMRYGIGVGRDGFTWSGVRRIERKMEWPDWIPPAEMIARQPYLPRFMAGGPGNPLGARAMYLAGTLYRIHGTSDPASIGEHVSSGCIRLLNEDAIDLYNRTPIGTKVVVLPDTGHRAIEATGPTHAAPKRELTSRAIALPVEAPPRAAGLSLYYGSSAFRLY